MTTIPVLITMVILLLAIIAVYAVVRLRRGPAPPAAEEGSSIRAAADEDPVPRDADGWPMVTPPEDPAEQDTAAMQEQAGERVPEDRSQRRSVQDAGPDGAEPGKRG